MRKIILLIGCLFSAFVWAGDGRTTIPLNGEWDFDQTEQAFPPRKFTRKVPVPGLVHLARPKISQYDKFFKKPDGVELSNQFNFLESDYTPLYNWYRRRVYIDEKFKGSQLCLTIRKSQYVTQVFVNGHHVGGSMECYTPIELDMTGAVKYGAENEILVQVGDRAWLPSEAAGGTDKEKVRYLPGIWDDVFITVTGRMRADKVLFLPSLAKRQVTAKILVRSLYPSQMLYGDRMNDPCKVEFRIKEKATGRVVAQQCIEGTAKRDNRTYFETVIPMESPRAWTPDTPFLYEGEVSVYDGDKLSDRYSVNFGMRDFARNGRFFTLNGEKFYLRGSNITLQRFFEDPDCQALAWDREWVKKLMIDLPKSVSWNAMRICVGVVPDFWYDLCDEYGIVLQNEWLYWQNHGWDEQVRKEYTNWVWSDGNHPSIVIWDAINENWDDYIGNTLIPELKRLDPTRIWDAGYMTSSQMGPNDEMDEPHPYRAITMMHSSKLNDYFKKNPYNLGALHDNWTGFSYIQSAGVPQLVNEYGWIWLWRDGRPSKLTLNNYNYYLGENATPQQCRELQAYWLELETEWLRTERSVAGILAFCHLTNNYGFTGDWFVDDIKDLKPSPAFRWFKHCFAPSAVFIDLPDYRYARHLQPLEPGKDLVFNLVGVNDRNRQSAGKVVLRLLDEKGRTVVSQEESVAVSPFGKQLQPCSLKLPAKAGAYLLMAEYHADGAAEPVLSRRYLKIGGGGASYKDYFDYVLP